MASNQRVHYLFHPVGQGLFASGQIVQTSNQRQFSWVYDCGTLSGESLLHASINNFYNKAARSQYGKPRLDLVTISHFDRDHISGITNLLKKFTVGYLLLPYIPLEQRLALAFSEGIDTQQSLIDFFINPVSYINNLEDTEIERIILVPASGDQGPPEDLLRSGNIDIESDTRWELDFAEQQRPSEEEMAELNVFTEQTTKSRVKPLLLKAGSSLRTANVWEFVPYNDVQVARLPDGKFHETVARRREILLRADSDPMRRATLAELRDIYDQHFGKRQRNLTSLFLYVGSISTVRSEHIYLRNWRATYSPDSNWEAIPFWWGRTSSRNSREGILYTGDGHLNTRDRLNRLLGYLGKDRVKRIGCFQVMHHGSERSWHKGIARELEPDISVFCADPGHEGYGHPHGNVVRDFLPYGPVLVDKFNGLTVSISFNQI